MRSFRWIIMGLTFLATIINYMDRSALAYAINPLKAYFGLTNATFGMMAASFGFGYLVMTVCGGVLVDRFGARKVWAIAAVAWSLACIGIGFANSLSFLILMRLFLGVAEGPAFPAMTRVAADWLPMRERGRALALGLAAVPLASVIGAPLISSLIRDVNWRVAFFALGSLGLVWAIVWYWIYRDKPSESKRVSTVELEHIAKDAKHHEKQQPSTWRYLLSSRTLLINNYSFFAFGYLLFFGITWLPGYLEQIYYMQLSQVGWFLVLPWAFATVLILLGGFITDWLWHRTKSIRVSRSHVIWVCQVLSAVSFLPVLFIQSVGVAAVCITLGIGFGLMPNAAFYALNADLAHDRAATSLGIMDAAFAIAGIFAPLITGLLAAWTGNFKVAIGLMSLLTFSSAMLIFFFQHPDKEVAERRV